MRNIERPLAFVVDPDQGRRKLLRDKLPQNGLRVLTSPDVNARRFQLPKTPSIYVLDESSRLDRQGLEDPVIITTHSQDPHTIAQLLDAGAEHVLSVPYNPSVLAAHVKAILRRTDNRMEEMKKSINFSLGGLEIKDNRVMKDGKNVILTGVEFKILMEMAAHPGRYISTSEFFAKIWGFDRDPSLEKVLRVHIRKLRTKIETNPSEPVLLKTHRGNGYGLVADLDQHPPHHPTTD